MLVEVSDQLRKDKAGSHIAPNDLVGLLPELLKKVCRPSLIGKQFCDQGSLGKVLMLGDRVWFKCVAVEKAVQYKGAIVLDILPSEAEEACLALK